MGARGQQRTQSRGGRRHPILERKGGAITKLLSPRGQEQRAGSPPLVGVGGVNPNFLNPDRSWGWGRPWIAPPDGAHIHRLGFGCVFWRPLSKSGRRQLDKLQSSWERLSLRLCGGTAWWARPSALISRPGIWDETRWPPPCHLGSPGWCPQQNLESLAWKRIG